MAVINRLKLRHVIVIFCVGLFSLSSHATFCNWLFKKTGPVRFEVSPFVSDNLLRNSQETTREGGQPYREKPEIVTEIIGTTDWMIRHLKMSKLNPWKTAKTANLLSRIKWFSINLRDSGRVDWKEGMEIATEFSNIMGTQRIKLWNDTLTFEDAITREFIDKELKTLEKYHHFISLIFTYKSFSVRGLNDLSPYPVFANQMVVTRTMADGTNYHPFGYFGHDVVHSSAEFIRAFKPLADAVLSGEIDQSVFNRYVADRAETYSKFRKFVDNKRNSVDKEVLELIWFTLFHENDLDHFGNLYPYEISRRALLTVLSLKSNETERTINSALGFHLYNRIHKRRELLGDNLKASQLTFESIENGVNQLLIFANQLPPGDRRGEIGYYLERN